MAKNTYYVTTAIDYVNAPYPHIGHAYQKIIADVLARWNKLIGKQVLFVTGTDEHGKKIAQSAEVEGKNPRSFVDEKAKQFKNSWDLLHIHYDRFIRTTDKDHEKVVNTIIKKIWDAGDVYKGTYEGLYCVGCEAYYTDKDLIKGECQFHPGRKLDFLKEETYFFKLSKYQKFLLGYIKKNPHFILPKARQQEIINRINEGLKDLSFTRTSIDWGIPFVYDKKHVVYVWGEALLNYYTATRTKREWEKFWPADLHLLGVDNSWFHTVIWPAMLKSAGLSLPKTVFVHGFLTFNGQKISKSLGNTIAIPTLVQKYSPDAIRYFVCRQFPLASGNDGDFSEKALVSRYNTELADKLGNLISRVSTLAEKYGLESVKTPPLRFNRLEKIKKLFENYELDRVLNEVFSYIDQCNEYIQSRKPWESHDKKVLYTLLVAIKNIAILLFPFIPQSCESIAQNFHFNITLKEINKPYPARPIKKANILFKKIEPIETNKRQETIPGVMTNISLAEFQKIELITGKILDVQDHPKADKLYVLNVDIGEKKIQLVAGLKQNYTKKELQGKTIVVIKNLEPAELRGVKSEGMLLAAEKDGKVVLLSTEKDIGVGAKIK